MVSYLQQLVFFYFKTMFLNYWGDDVPVATHFIYHLQSKVLGLRSHMNMLSKFNLDLVLQITFLLEYLVVCHLSSFTVTTRENSIHEPSRVYLQDTLVQKGCKCQHPPFKTKKNSVFVDVTFHENKSYFTNLYLQWENLIIKDKDSDWNSCLIDLSSPKQNMSPEP